MIDLTIHPNYVPRSTTRAEWKERHRRYRQRAPILRAFNEKQIDALHQIPAMRAVGLLDDPEVAMHYRDRMIDAIVNPPTIV